MQTLVYRYVLAAGGAHLNGGQLIAPERIEMRYWFAAHGGATETFAYDAAQMAADQARLLALVNEIDGRTEFPLTPDERKCAYCVYRSYCERGEKAGDLAGWDESEDGTDLDDFVLDLDQIAEIEF
jgi:hypothetical protein